jgi:hypothetical protein
MEGRDRVADVARRPGDGAGGVDGGDQNGQHERREDGPLFGMDYSQLGQLREGKGLLVLCLASVSASVRTSENWFRNQAKVWIRLGK